MMSATRFFVLLMTLFALFQHINSHWIGGYGGPVGGFGGYGGFGGFGGYGGGFGGGFGGYRYGGFGGGFYRRFPPPPIFFG